MNCPSPSEPLTSLRCRLRLTLDSGDGTEAEVELDLEESLRGPFDHESMAHLPARVTAILDKQLVPAFRRELRQWADEKVPDHTGTFEEEFVRRCDHNHRVMHALEWIAPHVETDEERGWRARMVEIFMCQEENDQLR